MEKIILYVIYFVCLIIQQIILKTIFCCIVKPKYSTMFIVSVFACGNLLQLYIKSIILKDCGSFYMGYFVFMIIFLIFLFEGTWYQKCMGFILNSLILYATDIISVSIAFGMLGYTVEDVTSLFSRRAMLISIFGVVVSAVLTYIVIIVQKPLKYIMFGGKMLAVFLIFFIQLLTYFIYNAIMVHNSVKTDAFFWLYFVVSIFINMYILQIMGELEIRQQSLEQLSLMQNKDETVRKYYQNLTSKLENISELRDGYERKLKKIYEELHLEYPVENDGQETGTKKQNYADNYVENYKDNHAENADASTKRMEIAKRGQTKQNVMDAESQISLLGMKILEIKKKEFDKLECSYDLDMVFPQNLKIEQMDFSSLLYNLLDNAMEAVVLYLESHKENRGKAKEEGEKECLIRAKSYLLDEMFVIEVENVKSSDQKVLEYKGKYITSKKEQTGHGYGLQIIQRIARKYGGEMEIHYTKNSFSNRVVLKTGN